MSSRLLPRLALAALLLVPGAAQAQLGKLGKRVGKAIGGKVVDDRIAEKTGGSRSQPTLTAEMLDGYLKGVAAEAGPLMAAQRQYSVDSIAYARWRRQVDSVSSELEKEVARQSDGYSKCIQSPANQNLMATQQAMAQKLASMSDAERERVQERMEYLGEKMSAAYQGGKMALAQAYSDSMQKAIGMDVSALGAADAKCTATAQGAAGNQARIDALNGTMQQLNQHPVREPRHPNEQLTDAQRDSLEALGIAESGLSESDYAWVREQAIAWLRAREQGDALSGMPAEWVKLLEAREKELEQYRFVILGY